MEKKNLLDQVDDGFNYFNDRMEELKTDDIYYIEAFMKYIEVLEAKVDGLHRQFINKF
jgi:DNA-binding LytR/AlgR family response regulator|tara:strand:- start:618 stop:791 length:174 start_codon:yes stop_codon:yes gene_type:complete